MDHRGDVRGGGGAAAAAAAAAAASSATTASRGPETEQSGSKKSRDKRVLEPKGEN